MNALEETKIDQGVDERVEVGDGFAIPKHRAFNAEGDCLAINAFGGGALVVNSFVGLTLPIQRIT